LFPEIKIIPCESKSEAFALINRIRDFISAHSFMKVSDLYEMLELTPIPENANRYCWLSIGEFGFGRDGDMYYVGSREPVEIIGEEHD